MSTQEKLVTKLIDEICDYDEYCGDENCKQCGGPIKFWKKKLTDLIDSAKREGAIEELKKLLDFPVAVTPNAHFGYDDMVFLDDIKDRIAQLEQSEESK